MRNRLKLVETITTESLSGRIVSNISKIVFYFVLIAFVLSNSSVAACAKRNKNVEDQIEVVATNASPSHEFVATLYIVSGGGAGGKVVNLRKKDERFDPKKGVVFTTTGSVDITLSWEGNDHFTVKHSRAGNIYAQVKEWGKVRISYVESD
ncbi:MAG: hypothetical protein DMF69_22700 [Acidobacteria bacterium]|nr:MAG: hypothetical protein DMF69_22700 [Acidobacteriota bacterium]